MLENPHTFLVKTGSKKQNEFYREESTVITAGAIAVLLSARTGENDQVATVPLILNTI